MAWATSKTTEAINEEIITVRDMAKMARGVPIIGALVSSGLAA